MKVFFGETISGYGLNRQQAQEAAQGMFTLLKADVQDVTVVEYIESRNTESRRERLLTP